MKRLSLRLLLLLTIVMLTTIRCSTSSLLSSGSSLFGALGKNANLSTLSSLMQTPGLSKVLGGALKKPFTLLAPTNNALSALGQGAVSNLANPDNVSQLAGLLKKHIIPGKLDPSSLTSGAAKMAADGSALDLTGVNMGQLIGDEKFNIIPVDKVLP